MNWNYCRIGEREKILREGEAFLISEKCIFGLVHSGYKTNIKLQSQSNMFIFETKKEKNGSGESLLFEN